MPQIESKMNQGHKIRKANTSTKAWSNYQPKATLQDHAIMLVKNHNWVYQKYMKNNALLKYKSVINSPPEYVYPVCHFILP